MKNRIIVIVNLAIRYPDLYPYRPSFNRDARKLNKEIHPGFKKTFSNLAVWIIGRFIFNNFNQIQTSFGIQTYFQGLKDEPVTPLSTSLF